MASLNSWLSPDLMQALGWALIHSLWQALSVAALAAVLMAFSRRPSVRYLVAVGALALMLAAPVATFLLLMKPDTPVRIFLPAIPGSFALSGPSVPAVSATMDALPVAVPSTGMGPAGAWKNLAVSSPNTLPWLVGAWLFGVALFSLRFAGGFLLLEHRRRRQSTVPSPRILALCRELQRQLGLNRAVRYLECGWLETPAVIGWLRPVLLLPVTALTGLTEQQLRAVIAHELAHIRRLDALVNLFQILVETLLFYHPAIWWLNKRIRAERELCCDEIAVSLTGDRLEYARALTLMAEWKAAPLLAMAANRAPLSNRILHILGGKPAGVGQRMLGLTGGILFLTATLTAANALFGIAYPVAQARASFTAALPRYQVVRQAMPPSEPAVESADATPDQIEAVETVETPPSSAILPGAARRTLGAHEVEIKTLAARLTAFAAPLILASAEPPPAEAQSDSVEHVIVTAPRLRPEKALDTFIITHAKPTRLGKIARWKDGICPLTVGLSPHLNQYVSQRIIRVAMTAGVPLAKDEPCRPNLLVLASAEPQVLLDEMRTKRPALLGFHYRSQAEGIARMNLPIQAWYGTATEDVRGRLSPDHPQMGYSFEGGGDAVSGNRTGNGLQSLFTSAIIIVDSRKIAGQEIGAFTDYIAMLALSQGQNYDVCQDIPSITNLMASGCGAEMKPAALTDIDLTYLRGLYKLNSGLPYQGQRGAIAFNMKKELGGY